MRDNIRHTTRVILVTIMLFLGGTGCTYLYDEQKPSRPPSPTFVHTVRWSGETLMIIAKWYTDKSDNWRALADANPHINPNRIFIANKISIPEKLLKTRQPMPREFVPQPGPKSKKVSKSPETLKATPPKKEKKEEKKGPDLFGPREFPAE